MEYRQFGQTGIQISAIGFGCWEIGGGYGSIEEAEFIKAINRALEVGINSFDTAEAYGFGASEKSLAKALGSRRKEAIITTKFGVGYPKATNYRDSSRQRVMESIEKSLKALNTDYVDVYLIHWPDRSIPFEEPMRALDDLVQQGKARAVGLSNFKLSEIETCMKARRVDVVAVDAPARGDEVLRERAAHDAEAHDTDLALRHASPSVHRPLNFRLGRSSRLNNFRVRDFTWTGRQRLYLCPTPLGQFGGNGEAHRSVWIQTVVDKDDFLAAKVLSPL